MVYATVEQQFNLKRSETRKADVNLVPRTDARFSVILGYECIQYHMHTQTDNDRQTVMMD